jgi:hypothetical protein
MKYISYLGIHYGRLETEIGRLISTLSFPGNENPVFNYMNIYRVFKDSNSNYVVTKNVENTLFSKPSSELGMGELELVILRDLMKNPWANAPAQDVHRVISLEGGITFLTDCAQYDKSGDPEAHIKYMACIDLFYGDLAVLGNLPPEAYALHNDNYDLIEFTKSVRPNRWALIQELLSKLKPGWGDWALYLEGLLCMQGMEVKNEEDSLCLYEREIELFSKLFI